jgi:phosphoribosylglycinamide formyltransferase 2
VIVEGFIDFDYEITLLTVTQKNGETLFCPPIGHRQERGDYQESWQPMPMNPDHLNEAKKMAADITKALGGTGLWGVEFFVSKEGVYFSELSPRPHDTGMVTLGNTQNFSEFELHARAILEIPIHEITLEKNGASAVILATSENTNFPIFSGLEQAAILPNTDFKIFGKPSTRLHRRMAVALAFGNEDVKDLVEKAKVVASLISVK